MGKSTINHHFSWENPLFLWPFSSQQTVKLPGRVKDQRKGDLRRATARSAGAPDS